MTKPLVTVTGATGYIGQHVIGALLQAGYPVRGTMRSLSKAEHVRTTLAAAAPTDQLEFAEADLSHDDGWPEAMAGATYLIHVASPIPDQPPKDPMALIGPARDGTLRALRAAKAAGVQRVVLTSSFASMAYGVPGKAPVDVTEEDWSDPDNHTDNTAYNRAKTLAERAAWDLIAGDGDWPELAVINPVAVVGPLVGRDGSASLQFVSQILTGKLPGLPDIGFPFVDVRDVARAHLLAMEHPQAAGERVLVSSEYLHLDDIAATLRDAFPDRARTIPRRRLPSWLIRILARFNPPLGQILPELGRPRTTRSTKARDLLGLHIRPIRPSIIDTARDLIEKDLL